MIREFLIRHFIFFAYYMWKIFYVTTLNKSPQKTYNNLDDNGYLIEYPDSHKMKHKWLSKINYHLKAECAE